MDDPGLGGDMTNDSAFGYRLQPTLRSLCRVAAMAVLICTVCSACATAPLTESGALSSYAGLKQSDGVMTKTRQRADRSALLAARSIRIEPTEIAKSAAPQGLTQQQLTLVTNTVDRTLCSGLSSRFKVVRPGEPSDLVAHAVITHIGVTDVNAAGVSSVLNIGGTVASAATGLPIPSARLPLGLGGLSVEAHGSTSDHRQVAAMTWARRSICCLPPAIRADFIRPPKAKPPSPMPSPTKHAASLRNITVSSDELITSRITTRP
jgi:hypothetical protein